jgi:hypothetical protein
VYSVNESNKPYKNVKTLFRKERKIAKTSKTLFLKIKRNLGTKEWAKKTNMNV